MNLTRRSFIHSMIQAAESAAIITSGVLMPIQAIAAPIQKAIILPGSKELILPGDIEVIACQKTAAGHRVGLKTRDRIVYVDAVLPAQWWIDRHSPRKALTQFQHSYAAKLYSERSFRA